MAKKRNEDQGESLEKRLKAAWQNSLGHQIPEENMEEYDVVKEDIVKLLKKVF